MANPGVALRIENLSWHRDGTLVIEEKGQEVRCQLPRRTSRYLMATIASGRFRELHPPPVCFRAGGKDWGLSVCYRGDWQPVGLELGRRRPYEFAIQSGGSQGVVRLPESSDGLTPGLVEALLAYEAGEELELMLDTPQTKTRQLPAATKSPAVTAGRAGGPAVEPAATGTTCVLNLTVAEKSAIVPVSGRPALGSLEPDAQVQVLTQALNAKPNTPAGRSFQQMAKTILARQRGAAPAESLVTIEEESGP